MKLKTLQLPTAVALADFTRLMRPKQANPVDELIKGIVKRSNQGLNAFYQFVAGDIVLDSNSDYSKELEKLFALGFSVSKDSEVPDARGEIMVRIKW